MALSSLERSLIDGQPLSAVDAAAVRGAAGVVEGRFAAVLDSFADELRAALSVAPPDVSPFAALPQRILTAETAARKAELLALGVAALQLFVQLNWTGPSAGAAATPRLRCFEAAAAADGAEVTAERQRRADARALDSLARNGESPFRCAAAPSLLSLARTILIDTEAALAAALPSASWWAARCAVVHQGLLSAAAPQLKLESLGAFARARSFLLPSPPPPPGAAAAAAAAEAADAAVAALTPRDRLLWARLNVERAHASGFYWEYAEQDAALRAACSATGLRMELKGVMGFRTKHQREMKAQLVLAADSQPATLAAEESLAERQRALAAASTLMPPVVTLDSDVLLAELKLEGDADPRRLALTDLLTVLCAEHVLESRSPSNVEQTRVERIAYLDRALRHAAEAPTSWAALARALGTRARLHLADRYLQEQALHQLEALSALFSAPAVAAAESAPAASASAALAAHRLADAHSCALQPAWALREQLAAAYDKLGMTNAALRLYEEIGSWEHLVEALVRLGRRGDAERVLRERLAEERLPVYLSLLGAVLDKDEYFEQAWEESEHTFARAQRELGKRKLDRKDYDAAIAHFERALAINPLHPAAWYAMGFAALETKRHALAANAFTRVVSFDPEYGDAWNNLAAAHIYQGNKEPAFRALSEAARLKRDSWQVWENLLHVAVALGRFQEAMGALERVVELKFPQARAAAIDLEVLRTLRGYVLGALRAPSSDVALQFSVERFLAMLDRITAVVVSEPEVWRCYCEVWAARGDAAKTLMYREKQWRAVETREWPREEALATEALEVALTLAREYLAAGGAAHRFAAKGLLEPVLARARAAELRAVSAHPRLAELDATLARCRDA